MRSDASWPEMYTQHSPRLRPRDAALLALLGVLAMVSLLWWGAAYGGPVLNEPVPVGSTAPAADGER